MIKTYIITSEKIVEQVESHQVVLPGIEGVFTLLPGHVDFASIIKEGEIRFLDANDNEMQVFKLSQGVCEFSNNECKIFVEAVKS